MIIPPLLNKNSKAIIIAPSGKIPEQGVDNAVKTLRNWGLDVNLGEHLYDSNGVFSGSDTQRLSDFQQALDDPTISLVLCARGGYGLTRILDKLSFNQMHKHPKWVVGFSDVTSFHIAAVKNDISTIHGPMALSFDKEGASNSINDLFKLLFTGESVISVELDQLRIGESKAIVVGGNLSLVCESLGTPSEIVTKGRILVLEDVGDYYYRIDRMLTQLERAGKFSNLQGLVIGDFSEMKNGDTRFNETVYDMILRLTTNQQYPIAVSVPIGHRPNNIPFVHGAEYSLDVKTNRARLELLTKL